MEKNPQFSKIYLTNVIQHDITNISYINVGADDPVRPTLTPIGKHVNQTWYQIPKIYDNVKLHSFVIMPDHIHGIIEICDNDDEGKIICDGKGGRPCEYIKNNPLNYMQKHMPNVAKIKNL